MLFLFGKVLDLLLLTLSHVVTLFDQLLVELESFLTGLAHLRVRPVLVSDDLVGSQEVLFLSFELTLQVVLNLLLLEGLVVQRDSVIHLAVEAC